jgi:hypothetical protein
MRVLLHLVPILLVELAGVSWTRRAYAIISMDCRFKRSAHGAKEGPARQFDESVPMPHHPQLFKDLSQGIEPWESHR